MGLFAFLPYNDKWFLNAVQFVYFPTMIGLFAAVLLTLLLAVLVKRRADRKGASP